MVHIDKIELRSDDMQEILGTPPKWIIRTGISIVLSVILVIIVGSWFFKYPDTIQAKVTLCTQNPPVQLKARASGKIINLFASEKQFVSKNEIIAVIENTANYRDIIYLKSILDTVKNIYTLKCKTDLKLGELQLAYSKFSRCKKDYESFCKVKYLDSRIKSVKTQIKDIQSFYNIYLSQKKLKEKELNLAKIQFQRDKELLAKGIYSNFEFEKAQKLYIQESFSFGDICATIANSNMQINQLKEQVSDLSIQKITKKREKVIVLEESFENLKNQIIEWEMNYIIKSSIDGKVTYTNIWSENQNISKGEIVLTIIPKENSNIIGRLEIPSIGIGKVKYGQPVNVKLDNFPYMEFGLLRCSITNISLIPVNNNNNTFYTAEISVPKSLVSNYGKYLKFSQEMTGTAEIITKDTRLLEKFLNPIRSVWQKNINNTPPILK